MKQNPIIDEIKRLASMGWPNPYQAAYFRQQAKDAKDVRCVSVAEVLTPEETEKAKAIVKKNQCFKNALLLAAAFPDRIQYVEGFVWAGMVKLEHAVNKVGDKYVDITYELALGLNPEGEIYASLIEADADEVIRDVDAHDGITGDYYLHSYIRRNAQKRA